MLGWGLLICVVVGAGAVRLEARIHAAEADRAAAVALNPEAVRWIEARVDSRRERGFSDEIELSEVVAADGLSPVPRRLRLRVPPRARGVLGRPLAGDAQSLPGLSSPGPAPPSGAVAFLRSDRLLIPGRRVRLGVRIAPLWPWRNPGAGRPEQRLARRGLAARASLVDPAWIVGLRTSGSGRNDWLVARPEVGVGRVASGPLVGAGQFFPSLRSVRAAISRRLAELGDDRGLVRALALGDRRDVSRGTRNAFQRLGLSHLLAVSGLHVGIVAGLAGFWLLKLQLVRPRAGRDPRGLVLAGSACAGAAFSVWSGGAVSAQRAAGGLALGLGLTALRRSVSPAAVLTSAGVALVAIEPARLFDVGTQLSFGACTGLILGGVWQGAGHRPLQAGAAAQTKETPVPEAVRWTLWRIALKGAALSLRASCAAGLGTAPVLAAAGMPVSLWGPVANLVAVPVTALGVLPLSLFSAAASFVGIVLGGMRFGPAGQNIRGGIDSAAGLSVRSADAWARCVETVAAVTPATPELATGAIALVWTASALGLWRLRCPQRGVRSAVAIGLAWLGAVAFAAPPGVEVLPPGEAVRGGAITRAAPPLSEALWRVWFFDVGQGDAALIDGAQGRMLVDTGPGPPDGSGGHALRRSLRALGIRRLDVLVLTHGDLDHRGGALQILEHLEVGEIWIPSGARRDAAFEALFRSAAMRSVPVIEKSASSASRDLGAGRVHFLWPPAAGAVSEEGRAGASRNARSLVLRIDLGSVRFLFLADVGAETEAQLIRRDPSRLVADVLKVSHHGSGGGSRAEFLKHVSPRASVVSAPCLRRRGLPNEGTMARIEAAGSRLWWTGRDGAIAAVVYEASTHSFEPLQIRPWAPPRDCRRHLPAPSGRDGGSS